MDLSPTPGLPFTFDSCSHYPQAALPMTHLSFCLSSSSFLRSAVSLYLSLAHSIPFFVFLSLNRTLLLIKVTDALVDRWGYTGWMLGPVWCLGVIPPTIIRSRLAPLYPNGHCECSSGVGLQDVQRGYDSLWRGGWGPGWIKVPQKSNPGIWAWLTPLRVCMCACWAQSSKSKGQ